MKQGFKLVLDYYTEIHGLWEELNSHRPMPTCTCNQQCRCEAMRYAKNFCIEYQIIQFLTSLNNFFSSYQNSSSSYETITFYQQNLFDGHPRRKQ